MISSIPDLQEPRYRPELNDGLGGTIEFGDGYLFPVELPAGKVRRILEDQASDGVKVRGNQFPCFTVEVGQGRQYDLLHSYGEDDPVDAIALYNADTEETVGFYDMDELIE